MIFRRRPKQEGAAGVTDLASSADSPDELSELESSRPRGPWDRSETTVDEGDPTYVDLGGLIVKGCEGVELRIQIDEQTESVASVLMAGPESGLELRAFAAPRYDGIWDEVRQDIAAEAAKRGGTATEVDGEFGTELKVVIAVQTPAGRPATQATRIVGVDGPRWLLRGTFLGKSADDADPDGVLEQVFRDVIVVRGDVPMAPRAMIGLEMPSQATQFVDDADA